MGGKINSHQLSRNLLDLNATDAGISPDPFSPKNRKFLRADSFGGIPVNSQPIPTQVTKI